MRGIILKDLYNLRGQLRIGSVLLLLYGAVAVYSGDYSLLALMVGVVGLMLTVTACSYDEKNKWERIALSMPLLRRNLVEGKYMLGLIFAVLGLLLNLMVLLLAGNEGITGSMGVSLGIFSGNLLSLALLLPILFRFGVEKGRLWMMVIVVVPLSLLMLVQGLPNPAGFAGALSTGPGKVIGPVLILALLAASFFLSVRIVEKKEF